MSYRALARKWRPASFDQVVGQKHVLSSLEHALDHNRLHHAYLLTGTRGVGKTTIARILAKALVCERGVSSTPCGECDSCLAVSQGRFVDLIEIDAASRTKVEDTRELMDNVQYAPTQGRYKIYLIDEVHMLSNHSFNALLKTLEEPPEHVKFLLATTDPQKLPVTILSRCLQYNLRHLLPQEIADHLAYVLTAEGVEFEPEALLELARAAKGSVRDGLSLLDQALCYSQGNVTAKQVHALLGTLDQDQVQNLLHAVIRQDAQAMTEQIKQLRSYALDYGQVLTAIANLLHQIALYQYLPAALTADVATDIVSDFAQQMSAEQVQILYQIALQSKEDINLAPDPVTGLEMALLRLMYFAPDDPNASQPKPAPVAKAEPKAKPKASGVKAPQQSQPQTQAKPSSQPPPAKPQMEAGSWAAILPKLGLSGMAKQLAAHCSIYSEDENDLVLCVTKEHESMLQPRVQERLVQALQEHAGINKKIKFYCGEHVVETPAAANARLASQQQQQAKASIEGDPNIRFMQAEFGAIIDPHSIKPV